MAYDGWLLKIGDWILPNKYIAPETYKVGVNKEKLYDKPDYNNIRHVVYTQNRTATVEFSTARNFRLSDEDVGQIQEALEAARVTAGDLNKNVYRLKFYDPSTDEYVLDKYFTLDPLKYTVYSVGQHRVFYNPIQFSFEEATQIDG